MLLHLPRKTRSEDDDYAPRDYNFVESVAEGARREQAKPIHRDAERATVRHRAEPGEHEAGLYGTDARGADLTSTAEDGGEPRGYEAARRLPRAADGPAPAASVAYPRPRDNAFAHTPAYGPATAEPLAAADAAQAGRVADRRATEASGDGEGLSPRGEGQSAYAPQGQYAQASAQLPVAPAQAGPNDEVMAPDGSRFVTPGAQEIPEWLRVAQQNNMPYYDEPRRRVPRVEPAPKLPQEAPATDLLGRPIARRIPESEGRATDGARRYEAAGYPQELIERQRVAEQEAAEQFGYGRKRHGAQHAAPPPATGTPVQRERRATPPDARYPAAPDTEGMRPYPPRNREAPARQPYAPRGADPRDAEGTPEHSRRSYPNPYLPQNETNANRDPWTGEPLDEEPEEEKKPRPPIPYLGIAVFAAAALMVALWIMQMTFTAQRENILTARAEATVKLASNHPFSYRELIEREAEANNLHPAFVAAIVLNESSFNPQAVSGVGARGLMQLMPETAEWVHGKMGLTDEYSFDQMYDADTNVHYACWYLGFLAQRFHNDPILVSAAFHAGQTTVQNWLNDSRYSLDSQSISLDKMAEGPTKSYVARVIKAFAVYRRLYYEGELESASALSTPQAAAAVASPNSPS